MKICIPVESDEGFRSKVYGHFGSAPAFIIFDTESGNNQFVPNVNKDHIHGTCNPIRILQEVSFKAVVCAGMGIRAVQLLNHSGIKVLRSDSLLVEDVIREFKAGKLEELTIELSCKDHNCH